MNTASGGNASERSPRGETAESARPRARTSAPTERTASAARGRRPSEPQEPRRRNIASEESAPRGGGERQAPRRKAAPRQDTPRRDDSPRQAPQESTDWVVDPRTGVRHRALPKTEWAPGSSGYSVAHIEDSYDATYDLDSMAKDFLGHLRVPPTKKELAQLKAERDKLRREQEEQYHELHDEDEEDEYGYDDE